MSVRQGSESTSESEAFDEYDGLSGDEQEKVDGALVLTLCSMKWECVDEATKLELQNTRKANIAAREALMRSKKKETIISVKKRKETDNIGMKKKVAESKNKRKETFKEEKSYDIRKFKKPLLGFGMDDYELPRLPPVERLRGLVGKCSKPFQKVLTASDVKHSNCRLILVRNYTIDTIVPLLDEGEREKVENEQKIDVTTFDEQGNEYAMVFMKWAKGKFYVLRGASWKKFFIDHSLEAGLDWVSIWSFRHVETGRLCFTILPKRIPITLLCYEAHRSI